MKRSTDRILTTHAGSLPRPDDLLEMIVSKSRGEVVDEARLAGRVRQAVSEIVSRQCDIGIDVVADGEMGKSSFLTYVTDRLGGFEIDKSPSKGLSLIHIFEPRARSGGTVELTRFNATKRHCCGGKNEAEHRSDIDDTCRQFAAS